MIFSEVKGGQFYYFKILVQSWDASDFHLSSPMQHFHQFKEFLLIIFPLFIISLVLKVQKDKYYNILSKI